MSGCAQIWWTVSPRALVSHTGTSGEQSAMASAHTPCCADTWKHLVCHNLGRPEEEHSSGDILLASALRGSSTECHQGLPCPSCHWGLPLDKGFKLDACAVCDVFTFSRRLPPPVHWENLQVPATCIISQKCLSSALLLSS